jgi:hypothetical protein
VENILNKLKGMSGGSTEPNALQECLDGISKLRNEFE